MNTTTYIANRSGDLGYQNTCLPQEPKRKNILLSSKIPPTPRYAPKYTNRFLYSRHRSRRSRRQLKPQLCSSMLVEEFLGFVDFGRQVRAPTAIGVVEEHELTVLLADLFLVERAFPSRVVRSGIQPHVIEGEDRTGAPGSRRLRGGSSGVQILCVVSAVVSTTRMSKLCGILTPCKKPCPCC